MKIGIIDLGTNTFNLLIAEQGVGKAFETLLNTKSAVMLGQEGLDSGYISDKAFTRAYSVLSDFRTILDGFGCDCEFAFGTSALRSASNSDHFITKIKNDLNITIQPISGDLEAEYIYSGVRQAVNLDNEKVLMMDIGGGSVEFIIANMNEIFWKESYPLGGARLLEKFKPGNPIQPELVGAINQFFEKAFEMVIDAAELFGIKALVGSSGAFDTFADMDHFNHHSIPLSKAALNYEIGLSGFENIYNSIVSTTEQERLLLPGMEALRVQTIVMSSILTRFILSRLNIEKLICSSYSLKEGVAADFFLKQNIRCA